MRTIEAENKSLKGVLPVNYRLYEKGCEKMSKSEAIHELYETCKEINFDETDELLMNAKDDDEKRFIRAVTDCVLQNKQRKVIAEKRF